MLRKLAGATTAGSGSGILLVKFRKLGILLSLGTLVCVLKYVMVWGGESHTTLGWKALLEGGLP